MAGLPPGLSATYIPSGLDDDYYTPPPVPELHAPEPQRINPEMPSQIQHGLQKMVLNGHQGFASPQAHTYSEPPVRLSPFPKLVNPSPAVPQSDEELETTLENARSLVLNSNDPEMQLAWAADVLQYVGVAADHAERLAAAKPTAVRPPTPRIEHQLKVDAMNVVNFLADQHHPKAEFLRGMWLEWGRFGQREDKKEAFRCYSRAADRGYARAEYRIGMLYESYNDPIKALRHYHRGVDAGDAASCYRLGMMTLRGQHGQQQDSMRAMELIKKSAEEADDNAAQGAYVYGMLLARQLPQIDIPETVLPYDERAARMYIEKAAFKKFAKAQLKMGSMYELGSLGCDFSPSLSVHYNALASKQGEAEADMALSKWFLVGSEGLFPKNEELAYTYAERAAQSGLSTAEFALGYFHEIGVYVLVNLEKALEWYDKASKHGNEDARGRIDGLNKKQVLNKRDHENVAISRIKSQYGSMRGVRPARLQKRQPASKMGQVSTIAETGESGYSETASGYGSPMPAHMTPPYGSSPPSVKSPPPVRGTTPYPLDNRPPSIAQISARPPSVAPYPIEDGHFPSAQRPGPPRLGPANGFFNPQLATQPPNFSHLTPQRPATTVNAYSRPASSAFQMNPNLRPSSAAPVSQLPAHGSGYAASYPDEYHRASIPQPAPAGVHRPAPADPTLHPGSRPGNGQRNASGPAAPPSNDSARVGGRSSLPSQQQKSTAAPGASTPKLDIGYSAPPVDRRGRPNLSGGPVVSRPAAANTQPDTDATEHLPASPNSKNSSRPGSRPLPGGRTPPNLASGGGGAVGSKLPPVPVKDGTGGPVGGAPASAPAKGPKTFEEMGVPASKQESDCVLM